MESVLTALLAGRLVDVSVYMWMLGASSDDESETSGQACMAGQERSGLTDCLTV